MTEKTLPKAYAICAEILSLRNSNHVTTTGKNAGKIVDDKIGRIHYIRKSDGTTVEAGLIAQGNAIEKAGEQLTVGKERHLYGVFENVINEAGQKTGEYFRVIGRSFTNAERAVWGKN